MTQHVFVRYTTLAPVFHSFPPPEKSRKNQAPQQRTLKIAVTGSDNELEVREEPVVSGNAIRCPARRSFVRAIYSQLELMKNGRPNGISSDMAFALEGGGKKGSGKGSVVVDPEKYVRVYDDLPFFGLFGGVLADQFFAGRLAVGFAYPITTSTRHILRAMGSPFADGLAVQILPEESLQDGRHSYAKFGIRDVVDDIDPDVVAQKILHEMAGYPGFVSALSAAVSNFKAVLENNGDNDDDEVDGDGMDEESDDDGNGADKKPKIQLGGVQKVLEEDPEAYQALARFYNVQGKPDKKTREDVIKKLGKAFHPSTLMPYSCWGAIPAGTPLHTRLSLIPGYGDDELMLATFHAYVEILLSRGYLGGMVARGYGAVAAEARMADGQDFHGASRAGEFWAWLDNRAPDVRDALAGKMSLSPAIVHNKKKRKEA